MSAYTRMFASSSSSPHQQHPPKSIVITGGSRGLGYALASCFLAAGDRVLLTSRSEATAQDAAARLSDTHHTTNMVHGAACDVTNWEHVAALAQTALQLLGGRIDVWINNAGVSQRGKVSVVESDPGDLENILDTNLLGSMYGTKAALQVMRQQQEGGGQVWLVDGNGARGNATPGNAAYGASKRALTQLLRSLVAETKGTGCAVHMLSPGMVATDLLFSVGGGCALCGGGGAGVVVCVFSIKAMCCMHVVFLSRHMWVFIKAYVGAAYPLLCMTTTMLLYTIPEYNQLP